MIHRPELFKSRFKILLHFSITSPPCTAPVHKPDNNRKEKGGMDPPACTKNQIPVAEKREDAGVTTMHGAQAKTYSGLTLEINLFLI